MGGTDEKYLYVHFHELLDGRLQAVYYDGPRFAKVVRQQIVHREGEDWPSHLDTGPIGYKCAACCNLGNGIEREVEFVIPKIQMCREFLDNSSRICVCTSGSSK